MTLIDQGSVPTQKYAPPEFEGAVFVMPNSELMLTNAYEWRVGPRGRLDYYYRGKYEQPSRPSWEELNEQFERKPPMPPADFRIPKGL